MKVLLVFGTRPEAIKMCPLIKEMKRHSGIIAKVCLTAQHREMLDQVMNQFDICADYDLNLMKEGQSLSEITIGVLSGLDKIFSTEIFDVVLVHGDTTTSFAASLSAFYHKIPVGHVEAGLRTHDLYSPYPEEFNRQAVDIYTQFYFAPTEFAKTNLIKEGKNNKDIYVTGNTVIDALQTTIDETYVNEHLQWSNGSRMILVTAHRRENIGQPMENMFSAIRQIADDNSDVKIIYPIHKNPAVRDIANMYLSNHERIRMIEPLDVLGFHNFIKSSFLILTDSGGIQEEAPALGKPVLVMRDTTERPEGVDAGAIKLVGTKSQNIYEETMRLLKDENAYSIMSNATNPYGDGHASERIVKVLMDSLGHFEKEAWSE